MDNDLDDWTSDLLSRACIVIVRYEEHLRSKDSITAAKGLAKAMRELKDVVPDEIMEVMRG